MQTLFPIRAFIDRIHNGVATLLLGEDESVTVSLPVSWLPAGVREGTVLRLTPTVDETAMKEGINAVQSLLDSLGNEP